MQPAQNSSYLLNVAIDTLIRYQNDNVFLSGEEKQDAYDLVLKFLTQAGEELAYSDVRQTLVRLQRVVASDKFVPLPLCERVNALIAQLKIVPKFSLEQEVIARIRKSESALITECKREIYQLGRSESIEDYKKDPFFYNYFYQGLLQYTQNFFDVIGAYFFSVTCAPLPSPELVATATTLIAAINKLKSNPADPLPSVVQAIIDIFQGIAQGTKTYVDLTRSEELDEPVLIEFYRKSIAKLQSEMFHKECERHSFLLSEFYSDLLDKTETYIFCHTDSLSSLESFVVISDLIKELKILESAPVKASPELIPKLIRLLPNVSLLKM